MNRDDIIRMAREAGIPIEIDWAGRPSTLVIKDGGTYLCGIDDFERFAELVAAAEREACAVALETQGGTWDGENFEIAGAIRARGEK